MKAPNRIRITPENGNRIAAITEAYAKAGIARSWNSVGDSAVGHGLAMEELRVKTVCRGLAMEELRVKSITKAVGKTKSK